MTKEQEKAIKRLEKRIKDNEDYKTTQVWLTDDVVAVETVLSMLKEKDERINDLEYALLDMVMQFADRPNIKGSSYALDTMGLSALELAFDELGFDNPYPVKKADEKYKILAKQYFERKSKE